MIGKFTLVSESCNVILKEEQARWSIRIVKGQSSQTSFAGSRIRYVLKSLFFIDSLVLIGCKEHIAK